jgi:hypothetical protein
MEPYVTEVILKTSPTIELPIIVSSEQALKSPYLFNFYERKTQHSKFEDSSFQLSIISLRNSKEIKIKEELPDFYT